jgi:NAD(P)-dependent dehydrogenase (short-subunit alcohol dehydrogenase family)
LEKYVLRNFNNKVVVITGGATGIGFSFAKRFGAAGAKAEKPADD